MRKTFLNFLFIFCAQLCITPAVLGDAGEPLLFLGNHNIPPVLFVEDDQPKGVVTDLFREISKRISSAADIKLMDWSEAQALVKNGQAAGLLQINRNPEREKFLLFSDSLLVSEFPIFRLSSRTDIQGPKDLTGLTVGVEAAGYPRFLLEKIEGARIHILKNWTEGFQLVSAGKIDAVLVDKWVGEYFLALNQITGISEAPQVVDVLVSHIAVRNDLPQLMSEINNALSEIKSDGTFEKILNRWKDEEVIYISRKQQEYWEWLKAALLLSLLLAVVAVVLGIKLSISNRSLKKQQVLLEQRVRERTEELQTLAGKEVDLRKEAEHANAELERSNQDLEQFAYVASHDLRSPLRGIRNLACWIAEEMEGKLNENARKYLELLQSRVSRLDTLLDSLLNYSRVSAAQHESQSVDVFALLQEVVAILDPPEGIVIDCKKPFPEMNTARVPLQQVLQNLIDNAIKHHDRDYGKIEVSAIEEGDHVVFRVKDDGPGIPPAYHDKVLQIFQTLQRKDDKEASGMGLAIVKRTVQRFGGQLTITSPLTDRGTEFRFTWRN